MSRHALITGGGRGIGAAIADRLLAEGWRVTVTGRNADALAAFAGPRGEHCHAATMEVTDRASVDAAMQAARRAFGPLQALVNNAGQAASAPFARTDAALFDRLLDINLKGVFHCTQAALPDLLAAGDGRIVNIASTAGLRGYPYVAAYVAAKHGVIGLTRALALELAGKGVTVNAVCPGYTDTDLIKEAVVTIVAKTGRSEAEARAELAKSNPQGRLVTPDEVADAVCWLLGPAAGAITGQSIAVAGGEIM